MKVLYRLWKGELALQAVFWNWAVLGGLLINVASSLLFLTLITADQTTLAFIFGYGFSVPYNVFVSIGVWRSAGRFPGDRRWADMARIATVVGMVLLSVT